MNKSRILTNNVIAYWPVIPIFFKMQPLPNRNTKAAVGILPCAIWFLENENSFFICSCISTTIPSTKTKLQDPYPPICMSSGSLLRFQMP